MIDRRLYRLSQRRLRAGWANAPMVRVTQSGTKGGVWVLVIVLLFTFGNSHARSAAFESLAALLLAEGVINLVLKPSIARERPYAPHGPGRLRHLLIDAPGAHSWPSTHAGSAMAAAVPLAVAYPWWGIGFLGLAGLIGFSRIYVGVHYPFDVASGAVVGGLCGIAVLACAFLLASTGF